MSGFAKSVLGFVIGAAAAIAVLALLFEVMSDGGVRSIPSALGIVPLMSGMAAAKLFQRQNLLAHFDRLSFGMKRRFPVAVYGAWAVLWFGYLVVTKDDVTDWYSDHEQKFWLMLLVPPSVILVAIILFRWADAPNSHTSRR